MSSVGSRAADVPLCPLLFADGTAASAVSVYCSGKQGDGDRTTAEPEKKTISRGPVWEEVTEPTLLRPTEIHQDQMRVSVSESEEKHQKSMETIAQLEVEKCELLKQVETLRDNVEEMGDLLHKHNMESANLTKVCVQEWEELLKVSMAEAEEKHQKSMETIAQLEEENCELMKQVETLRDTVKESERERDTHSLLQLENEDRMKSLIQEKELMKVSLAEAEEKQQRALETIAQLEEEKCVLCGDVETLRETVQEMGNDLFHTHRECDRLTDECEREQEAYTQLQSQYNEMKKTYEDPSENN